MSKRNTTLSGSVLVAVLWCLALLSMVVIGVLHSATLDSRVIKNYGDRVQAHYLALAGIEKAKALLYEDARTRKRSAVNHSGDLYDSPQEFRDVPLGRGRFRVLRQGDSRDPQRIIYGISDEESRINLNQATPEELANFGRLYKMTTDVVASLVDWRDQDNVVTPTGAEGEYYVSLQPPYLPRNGPFQTTREILMVRGISPELFRGEDVNLNGLLDPDEDDGSNSDPPDNHDGLLDPGWSGMITLDSSVQALNAGGQDRVNIQSADENTLTSVRGISADLAKAIIAHRGQNRLESLADLFDVARPAPQNQARPAGNRPNQPGAAAVQPGAAAAAPAPNNAAPNNAGPAGPAPNAPNQPTGPKLVTEELLMEIADDITASDNRDQPGLINVNTASAEVLACLPGLNLQLGQAIVSYRQSAGFLANVAFLLKVPGITREIFKQIASRVTTRSETFRIFSEGQVTSSGARSRIQVIVRLGTLDFETLSYREDL